MSIFKKASCVLGTLGTALALKKGYELVKGYCEHKACKVRDNNRVDQDSRESFPASDPPAHSRPSAREIGFRSHPNQEE